MTEVNEEKRSSESIFRFIAENAYDMIAILNQNYEYEYLNEDAHIKIIGYSKNDLLGLKVLDLIEPTHLQNVIDGFRKGIETGQLSGELKIIHKKGDSIWLESRGRTFMDKDGTQKFLLVTRDISKRKKTEVSLKESEKRYRSFLYNFRGIAYRGGMDWKPIFFHGAVEEITGYTESDFILGKPSWNEIIHPEDVARLQESAEAIKNLPNYSTEREYRIIRKDGEIRWVFEIIHNITDDVGKPIKVQGTIYDLTARKNMEEKLRESEEKFKLITEQSLMAIIILQDGVLKYVNEAASTIGEYSIQEMMNWGPYEFGKLVHPDDLDLVLKQTKLKQTGHPGSVTHYYVRIITKSGKLKWVSQYSKSIPYQGSVADLITLIDITLRKEAEQQLIESEEKYRLITENASDLIGIVNQKFEIEYMNEEAVREMSGFSSDDLIGKNALEFVHPSDHELVTKALLKGFKEGGGTVEIRAKHKDGYYFWLELRGRTFQDKNGKLKGIVISRDITARKMTEDVIKERLKFEKFISSISSRFVSSSSFDENINDTLADLGKMAKISRAYLFQLKDNKSKLDNTHEWCAEGVEPQKDALQNVPVEMYPWSLTKLNEGDIIHIKDVSKLPDEATTEREILERQDIRSVLIVPLFSANQLIGFMGFDEVFEIREWSDFDLEMLRISSQIMGNAFESQQAEKKLRESEEKFKLITEQSLMGIVILQDEILKYVNEATSKISEFSTKEMLNWPPNEFGKLIFPEDAPFVMKQAEIKQKGGVGAVAHYYYRILSKSGKLKWVSQYSKSISYEGKMADLITLIDITERKKAEFDLEKSRLRLEYLLRSSPAVIYSAEAGGHYPATFISENVSLMIGFNSSQFLDNPDFWFDHIHPEDQERVLEEVSKLFKKGRHHYEYRFRVQDGSFIWMADHMELIRDSTGEPVEIVGYWADISERMNAVQQLRESEERYRFIAENIDDVISLLNKQLKIEFVNEAIERLSGYSINEMMTKDAVEFIHPEDIEKAMKLLEDGIKTGSGQGEFRLRRKDGAYIWVEVIGRVIHDKNNEVKYILVNRDISERKKLEQELKESEELYRTLLKTSPEAVTVTDLQGNITYVSERTLELNGFETVEELRGKSAFDLIDPKDHERALQNLQKTLTDGLVENLEYTLLRKDGTSFIGELSAALVKDALGNPKGFIATTRNITERKQAEIKLKQSEENFREAYNRAEFYKDLLSHDMSNILQSILFSAESGIIDLENKEKLSEKLNEIGDQVKRGAKLISNVRKLSKLEKGEPIIRTIEVLEVLKNTIEFVQKGVQAKDVEIRIEGISQKVYVEANDLLRDVFENILQNAIKYNQSPLVEILVRISKEQRNDNKFIKMEFIDNGIGIRDISKEAIFERGYREDGNVGGRGIGLSLVKQIVTNYNGKVRVEDRALGDFSRGSNFVILIPEARTLVE